MPVYNYQKLKGRITEKFGNQRSFATFIGTDEGIVSKLLHSKIYFSQDIIEKWCGALGILTKEISEYFFTKQVDEIQTKR